MDVIDGLTMDEWKELRRDLYIKNKKMYFIVCMGVECGMAPNEIIHAKVANMKEHRGNNVTYGILKLDEGCKGLRVGRNRDRTEKRYRNVIFHSKLYDEWIYFCENHNLRSKKYMIQNNNGLNKDGISLSTIEVWYRDHKIPFTPHAIKRGIFGARHLHKRLIESVCALRNCYVERQVEAHLGHMKGKCEYGYALLPDVMDFMLETTFVRS